MNPFVQLGLVAEIAATYLGFIAVFIVFSRDDGRFAESDKHFVQGLVVTATSAIVFALLPRVLVNFYPDKLVWNYSLLSMLIIGTIVTAYQAWSQFVMSEEEAKKVHWGWHFVGWAIAVAMMLLVVAGVVRLLPTTGAYVAAVTSLILVSIWTFIAIVFRKFF